MNRFYLENHSQTWNANNVIALISQHLEHRPAMELRDIYKLLYQGVRGPEHLITSTQAFSQSLLAEWDILNLSSDDMIWESIRPDEKLLRINLKPFKLASGSLNDLLSACLETSQRKWSGLVELRAVWDLFSALCREGTWVFINISELVEFSAWLEEHGFPAVPHSECYRSNYKPAYRLVAHDLWELINPLKRTISRW